MNTIRLAYGSLHHSGARALPCDLEGVDLVLLDGGPRYASDAQGPEEALRIAAERFAPRLFLDPELRVLAGLAGREPTALAHCIGEQLCESGNETAPVGVVRGGDVLDRVEEFLRTEPLENADTGEAFNQLHKPVVAACARLGHEPPAAALGQGARVTLAAPALPGELAAAGVAHASEGANELELLGYAARAGEALARVVVDAEHGADLAAADLVFARRLVAEVAAGGGVTFVGDSPDSPLARRASELFHDLGDQRDNRFLESLYTDRTPVDIVYRQGFLMNAALELIGPEPLEGLIKASGLLREGLAAEGVATNGLEVRLWREAGREDAALGLVAFRHESQAAAEAAQRRVRRLAALWEGGPWLPEGLAAQVSPEFRTWRTSVPSELVEWSVDVRPAQDWID